MTDEGDVGVLQRAQHRDAAGVGLEPLLGAPLLGERARDALAAERRGHRLGDEGRAVIEDDGHDDRRLRRGLDRRRDSCGAGHAVVLLVLRLDGAVMRAFGEARHRPHEVTKPIEVRDHEGVTQADRRPPRARRVARRCARRRAPRRVGSRPGRRTPSGSRGLSESASISFSSRVIIVGGDERLLGRELATVLRRRGDLGHQHPEVALDADEQFVESRTRLGERARPAE